MRRSLLPGLLVMALYGRTAAAQDAAGADVQITEPSADGLGYFAVPSADTLGNLQLQAALWLNYANDPVLLTDPQGNRIPLSSQNQGDDGDGLLDDLLTGHLLVGMGVTRSGSLTVDLPVTLFADGTMPGSLGAAETSPVATAGLGDLRIVPKYTPLHSEDGALGLALVLPVTVPTGDPASLTGEMGATVSPALVAELSNGEVRRQEYTWRLAMTGGYLVRPATRVRDVSLGNAATWGLAVGVAPAEIVELMLEIQGEVAGARASQQPAEFAAGLKLLPTSTTSIHLGAGAAALGGLGAPDYRVMAGFSVHPSFDKNDRDVDEDGIVDGLDRCVEEAEDLDGFQDSDGCPDLDNDADRVPDETDSCPNDPEDDDGWRDVDGCPDKDNDQDEILDIEDRCPNEPETWNGFADEDGCPDEEVGDKDEDGIPDTTDRCPYDAEDFDGDRDEDGCPDEGRVVVEKSFIKITESIYFDTGKATIQPRSFDLLNEIASVIAANPKLKLIRVEGHTDDVGSSALNLRLSQARAGAVRQYLTDQGVDETRLDARGFGESYPIQPNDQEEGRAANRRVEFIIVDQE